MKEQPTNPGSPGKTSIKTVCVHERARVCEMSCAYLADISAFIH